MTETLIFSSFMCLFFPRAKSLPTPTYFIIAVSLLFFCCLFVVFFFFFFFFFFYGFLFFFLESLNLFWPRGYKTFFHAQLSMIFSLLMNMKMPAIIGIFIFISREFLMLSYV